MEDKIKGFFNKHVIPQHEKVKKGELSYFELTPDESKKTYFSETSQNPITYYSFIDVSGQENLQQNIDKIHQLMNVENSNSLSKDISKLAFESKEKFYQKQSEELPGNVYVMF